MVIETSAVVVTLVFAVELLLPGVPSAEADETDAVLLTVAVPAGPFTLSVKTAGPTAIELFVQVTVPVLFTDGVEQLHPPGETSEENVVPAGIVSFNVALMAGFGPLFVTVIV